MLVETQLPDIQNEFDIDKLNSQHQDLQREFDLACTKKNQGKAIDLVNRMVIIRNRISAIESLREYFIQDAVDKGEVFRCNR